MRPAGALLAAGLLAAVPAPAAGPPLLGAETVTLDNGLRLVLSPDPEAPSVDVAVWYDAGSRHDRPGKSGVAHLFEHLMFRGSAAFGPGEHARLVRAEGGTSGAFASHDVTCFYQTLPPDALELAFRLEADRMARLAITQAGLDGERRLVAGERARRRAASPGLERLAAMAFAGHPYGTPLFGREAELAKVTLKDLQEFYRAHYGPARATVTVAGNFGRDDAVSLAQKHFGPLKAAGGRPGSLAPPRPAAEEKRSVERHDAALRALMVGWAGPRRSDPDWPALSLIAPLLTRATDAPLARALVLERPLCLSVTGDVESRREASLLHLRAVLHPEADSAEVETAMLKEVSRLLVEPVAEADLERAKRQVESGAWFSLQTSRGRGQALGSGQTLAQDPRELERQLERLRACTAEDVMRAARRLAPARRNVLWLLPAAGAEAGAAVEQR
jgi:zinc protease